MTRISLATACSVAVLGSGGTAMAQVAEDDLAQVFGDMATVSIATGSQQALRRAPAIATVITAVDIEAMGATNLDEVMETVPGVHVARNPIGNTAVYTLRGIYHFNNPQVLMLQNGVPMTTMFLGSKGGVWGGLPLENVARVEIIRGPGSALYGADAYAGVINIITKTAGEIDGTRLGARVGSFGSRDVWALHGGKLGPVEVAAYLKVGGTDGAREVIDVDAQSIRDRTSGLPAASFAPGPMNLSQDTVDGSLDLGYGKWRLRGGYKLRDRLGVGAGVSNALDPDSRARSERFTADLSWLDSNIARDWSLGATASYLYYADTIPTNLLLAPPGAKLGAALFPEGQIGGPNKWERQLRLSAFAAFTGFADHTLRVGIGHDDLNLYKTATYKNFLINTTTGAVTWTGPVSDYSDIQPFMTPQRRRVNYVYVQDEWRFRRDWTLTAGIRRDAYSDVGGTTNPRLGLVWDASLNVTFKLLAGSAFRAPAFNDLHGINNPVNKGNPNLKPETIQTREAAVSWQARKNLQLNLSVYRYRMADIIRAVADTPGSRFTTFQNSGSQRGNGFELETVWDLNWQSRLSANYSRQKSYDTATNQDTGYAPHHHLYARGDWRFQNGWLASAQVNLVADRKRPAGDTRPPVPDYTTVDLTVRTKQQKNDWTFASSIRNLFNARVVEPSLYLGGAIPAPIPNDLPQPRRSVYFQATLGL